MSEQPLDDIKKICLICGCHTKQAINIYEPRNGPNIIELIRAKFKFQPVNDDKYLCYSCNNWLINWHSLQSLNNSSNNESGSSRQSSKSRSHINESIPEEECDEGNVKIRNAGKYDDNKDDNGSGDHRHHQHQHYRNDHPHSNNLSNQKRKGFYFSRRHCIKWRRIRKVRRKYKQYRSCAFCGRSLKTHLPIRFRGLSKKISIKCKTCSRILEWSANYSKTLLKEENRKLQQFNITNLNKSKNENDDQHKNGDNCNDRRNKNDKDNNEIFKHFQTNLNDLVNPRRYHHQRPLIDGKVVAMLRRLGTTLTRESDCYNVDTSIKAQNINKQQQQEQQQLQTQQISSSFNNHKREMEENEILIDFNTAITEVLQPFDLVKYQITSSSSSSSSSSSCMIGPIRDPDVELIEVENEEHNAQKTLSLEAIYKRIPKCVTISVIGGVEGNDGGISGVNGGAIKN